MFDLFSRATEDHRVTGLEPHHLFSLESKAGHHIVDVTLSAGGPPTPLADHQALRLSSGELQHILGHEIVEEDDIGGLKGAHGFQRQQFRIARTGSDEGHAPNSSCRLRCDLLQHRLHGVAEAFRRLALEGKIGEALPKRTPCHARRSDSA